ncbi:MAG: tetratricopeptide repeat protein [Anaerolineae bacterium]|nr:tetratricopeptide repeat protein [Anaerolineae bacterium]
MTTITLREYHQRIDKLIDENMLTEAITHCRHVLETHSSHIDTYRLLAKALLEQHDYDGAADLFQRVLSAEPNDFVAHVGLSIIRSEESQVEDALWHLQRAFEIEPYNAAIQEELRRHYAQFSDLAVDRIPLTSGALARLYIKGELYQQAVQELRQTIQHSQDRVDLEVLLAEALWRNDQRVDAEEVCLNVLQKLPNCIVVNAILSEIWLQTGRIGESQKYLRRLLALTSLDKESLDLDTAVGRAFRSDGAPPLPDQVEVEVKGDAEMMLAGANASPSAKGPSADWMSEMTFDSDAAEKFEYEHLEVAESPSGMHNYDWMAEVNDDLTPQENLPVESEWFMDEELKAEPSLEDDWLADVGAAAMGTAVSDDEFDLLFADEATPLQSATAMQPEDEDWFLTQSEGELQAEETFASEQSVPEWLIPLVNEPDLSDVDEMGESNNVGSDWFAESETDATIPTTDSKVPDWLSNLVDDGPAQPTMDEFVEVDLASPTAVAHEQDDWMIDEHAEDHWDEGDYAEEEMPDWLRKQTGELDAELATSAGSGEMDDWLTSEPTTTDGVVELEETSEESLFTGWLSDEPEEHAAAIPAAAALGLTAMFAALDDDLSEEETQAAVGGMDELDDLFAEVDDEVGTAVPSTQHDAETNEDDWLSGLGLVAEEEPMGAVDWADGSTDDTVDSLDNLRQSLGDVADASAADIGLDSDWLTMPDDVWADDVVADNLADLTVDTTDVAAEFSIFWGAGFRRRRSG